MCVASKFKAHASNPYWVILGFHDTPDCQTLSGGYAWARAALFHAERRAERAGRGRVRPGRRIQAGRVAPNLVVVGGGWRDGGPMW